MSAPVVGPASTPVAVADDAARDDDMRHIFCSLCVGNRAGNQVRALCGTLARMRGVPLKFSREVDCRACLDLVEVDYCQGGH